MCLLSSLLLSNYWCWRIPCKCFQCRGKISALAIGFAGKRRFHCHFKCIASSEQSFNFPFSIWIFHSNRSGKKEEMTFNTPLIVSNRNCLMFSNCSTFEYMQFSSITDDWKSISCGGFPHSWSMMDVYAAMHDNYRHDGINFFLFREMCMYISRLPSLITDGNRRKSKSAIVPFRDRELHSAVCALWMAFQL